MGTTLAEIAKLAGCSSATVSRAIHNSGSVSPETRDAVLKAIKQTQYSLQRTGRRGRPPATTSGRGTHLVEILFFRDTPMEQLSVDHGELRVNQQANWTTRKAFSVPYHLSASFYLRIVDGAVKELSQQGYRAVVQAVNSLAGPDALAEVNKPDRDGVLLIGEYTKALGEFVDGCIHPLVLVDLIHSGKADVVTTDNIHGISLAFDHIYSLGHRKIGFVGLIPTVVGFVERFTTYKWKMAEVGLPVNPQWIHSGPNRIDETEAGVAKILSLPNRPTALICANDMSALGAIRAASRMGIRVPEELSIIGFDDEESASLVTPPLTTIRTPMPELGQQSARQLILQIEHQQLGRTHGCQVRLPPELVIRQSTAEAPRS